MAGSRRIVTPRIREIGVTHQHSREVVSRKVFTLPDGRIPKGPKLENIFTLNGYVYTDRRKGPDERRDGDDRRKGPLGQKVSDVKKKPAFEVTETEYNAMNEHKPKVLNRVNGKVVLKDRRRTKDRRQ